MIENTILMKKLKEKDTQLHSLTIGIYEEVKPLLNSRVAQTFPTYTQHDVGHSIRILEHIEQLISNIDALNPLELTLIILSALLHDVGMAAKEEEIEKIKKGELTYNNVNYQALLEFLDYNETDAIQEYIRKVHADRSAKYIRENLMEKLALPNMPNIYFSDILALICKSHTEDIIWVKNNLDREYVIGEYKVSPQFYAILLRLGDILDFDSLRTPKRLYDAINPSGYSNEEWKQHFNVKNTKKIFEDSLGNKTITFYGECSEPKIHRKILSYIDWINQEITNALDLTKDFKEPHKLELYPRVIDNIKSDEYSMVDVKFQMNYKNMINLLMGESLYGDKKIGLRELIQNSIDACLLLKEIKSKNADNLYDEYKPRIYIIIDKEKNLVRIKDNGVGMSIYALKKYFLEVGSSYFKSQEFLLSGYKYTPIGNYGIGFLASFMLSDSVKIKTRDYKDNKIIEVDISKDNEYVSIKETTSTDFNGTEIILDYEQFFSVFEEPNLVEEYIKENFLMQDLEIIINIIDSELRTIGNRTQSSNVEISLSKYLDGLDVTLYASHPLNVNFVEYLDEIKRYDIEYYFDGTKVNLTEGRNIHLKNYLLKNQLKLISFMIIEDAYDLDQVIEFEEYHEEDIESYYEEKYSPDEANIAILPSINYEKFSSNLIERDEIIEGLTFKDLEDLEGFYHDNSSGTFFSDYSLNFWGIPSYDKYLEFASARNNIGQIKADFFVRNVFVQEHFIGLENPIYFQKNKLRLKLNVYDKSIVPNVARNKLASSDIKLLSNSIQQAIYLYLLEDMEETIEKIIFKEFVKKHHIYKETLLKEDYKEKLKYM